MAQEKIKLIKDLFDPKCTEIKSKIAALRFYKENVGSNYTYPFENNSSIATVNVSDPS